MEQPLRLRVAIAATFTLLLLGCRNPGAQTARTAPGAAATLGGFWVEPYLQNPKPDGMTILWWTPESAPNDVVEYGIGDTDRMLPAANQFVPEMGKWSHMATLTGLTPETEYWYRVRSRAAVTERRSLHTAKRRSSDLEFSFLGDARTDNAAVIDRRQKLLALATGSDLVLELGDQVAEGSQEHWERYLREIMTPTASASPGAKVCAEVPCHLLVGNHEIATLPPGDPPEDRNSFKVPWVFESIRRFTSIVENPPNGSANAAWEERYYSIRYGAATFIVLDLNNTSDPQFDNHDFLAAGTTPDWEPGSEQYRWMVAELDRARRESAFTFVLAHPSPFSPGIHGTPDHQQDQQRGYELRILDPIFRSYGVDAVITSHDHFAARSVVAADGVSTQAEADDPQILQYFVVGNSGYEARSRAPGWQSWMSLGRDGKPPFYTRWFYSWEGQDERTSLLRVHLRHKPDGVVEGTFVVVRDDGREFDEVLLRRMDPTVH